MNQMNQQKANAKMDKGMGAAKETTGNMFGNKRMESEGQAQRQGGKMEEMEGKAKEMWDNAKDKVEGAFNGGQKSMGQQNH